MQSAIRPRACRTVPRDVAPLSPYRAGDPRSYTSGAYATLELLRAHPERMRAVYLHPDCREPERIVAPCRERRIPVHVGERAFQRINRRENAYVLGVFDTYATAIRADRPHIVLVQTEDEGNLGTIARTLAALDAYDLALVAPIADIWHPKAIRASMGAVFRLAFEAFDGIDAYRARFPGRPLVPFMLDAPRALSPGAGAQGPFSLVFGAESSGLPGAYHALGEAVRIPHSSDVDSLNLAAAVAIGAYVMRP